MSIQSFLLDLEHDVEVGFGYAEQGVTDIGIGIGRAEDFFDFINSREGWIRVFEVLFGGLLIIGAIRYGR